MLLTPSVTVNTRCYTLLPMAPRRATPRRRPAHAAGPSPLQEKKRRLVRQEIEHAAWLLFAARGYEAATVDDVARGAGVSRRTFFRYFSSKEDVVVGTSDALAEDVLAGLAQRPRREPPLVAIHRALRPVLVSRLEDADEARAIIRLLRESRTLRRAMLERHARMEERLAVLIAERTGADPGKDRRRRCSRSSPGRSWTRRSTSGTTSTRPTSGPWSTPCSRSCGPRSRRGAGPSGGRARTS